jgi:hypothetical protein
MQIRLFPAVAARSAIPFDTIRSAGVLCLLPRTQVSDSLLLRPGLSVPEKSSRAGTALRLRGRWQAGKSRAFATLSFAARNRTCPHTSPLLTNHLQGQCLCFHRSPALRVQASIDCNTTSTLQVQPRRCEEQARHVALAAVSHPGGQSEWQLLLPLAESSPPRLYGPCPLRCSQ